MIPVVIVSGPPASGKSTLASRIASDFSLPAITKDGIKEALLDAAGTVDVEESKSIGRGAWAVLWHALEVELTAGRSALVEGNFSADPDSGHLARLTERFGVALLQIHCHAPVELLYARYEARIAERHPGHTDAERLPGLREALDPDLSLLAIPGRLISVDTSSFGELDYEELRAAIGEHLQKGDDLPQHDEYGG
jgi:predicted kinase